MQKARPGGGAFLIGWFVEKFLNGRLGGRFRIHASKWLKRILGELGVHSDDSRRLRDECFVASFRIFGADFHQVFYNGVRTHRSLNKDAPVSRSVQRAGVISSRAILGGLHHHYGRI